MTMFTDDQLRYHAEKGGFPQRELAEELLALRAQLKRLRRVAEHFDVTCPPNDWNPYDTGGWGGYDYPGHGEYGDENYVDAPDSSNSGDMHNHGVAVGRWFAAKALRGALADDLEQASKEGE